jgi:hypothetical protein
MSSVYRFTLENDYGELDQFSAGSHQVLDKLVAVQIDLDPLCRSSGQDAENDEIANACKVRLFP